MAYITGSGGNDSLGGTGSADTMSGGAGNDTLRGGGGRDLVHGDAGDDSLHGDAGDDTIHGGGGADSLYGGAGFDRLYGGDGNDFLHGDSDLYDDLYGGAGDDAISAGTSGLDVVAGGAGNDLLYGGGGDYDSVYGGAGNDLLFGGSGRDELFGGEGRDQLHGGAGADKVLGGGGHDTLDGGAGNDSLEGGDGNDSLLGGDGDDVIRGDLHHYAYEYTDFMEPGAPVPASFTNGSDLTLRLYQINTIGMPQQDGTLAPGQTWTGTAGIDQSWQVENAATGQVVGLYLLEGAQTFTFTGQGDDVIRAGAGNDTLHGDHGNDLLHGDAGNDRLFGGSGNDTLEGGGGDDRLTGGAGADLLVFVGGAGNDTVSDFDMTLVDGHTTDRLDIGDLTNPDGSRIKWGDFTITAGAGGFAFLTFPEGETVLLEGILPGQIDISVAAQMGLPCLVTGTGIDTALGPRPVETLRPGDLVLTPLGPRPVLWAGGRSLDAAELAERPAAQPVVIRQGALGNGRALCLSRQHCLAIRGPGGAPRLVRAAQLAALGRGAFRQARGRRQVGYHHLLLPQHTLIRAEGVWVESLWPGPAGLAALGPRARDGIAAALPRLAPALIAPTLLPLLYGPKALPGIASHELARLEHILPVELSAALAPAGH